MKLNVLEENDKVIIAGLNAINTTMTKTKTAVYTVVFVLIVQKLGLFETLKLLIDK